MSAKGKDKKKPNGPTDKVQPAKTETVAPQEGQGIFSIQRLFTKGVTFDAPQLSNVFAQEWKPQLDINIQSNNALIAENMHEVELQVTVSVKLNEQTAVKMIVKQAGIFNIQNFTKEQVDLILGSECLKILYPYAREAITDLTSRATLPQLFLTPLNFDAIYAQQQQQRSQQTAGQG